MSFTAKFLNTGKSAAEEFIFIGVDMQFFQKFVDFERTYMACVLAWCMRLPKRITCICTQLCPNIVCGQLE